MAAMERLKETLLKRDEKGLTLCLDTTRGCSGTGSGEGVQKEGLELCLCFLSLAEQCEATGLAVEFDLALGWETSPSLEHLYMEYDEDDDIFFAKWMSSFWGHNLIDEEKEGRGHKKRQPRVWSERRASLPDVLPFTPWDLAFQAKLSSLHTTRLHASAKGSSSGHLRGSKEFQEDQDVKCHCHRKASRTPSADSSCPETSSNSIQEFAESFEKQLHLKSKRSISLQPEGAKERREREKLHLRKTKSHKKMGEKSEARRDREEAESSEVSAKHSEQFPSQASIQKGYVCTGS